MTGEGSVDMDVAVHVEEFGKELWAPIDTAARSVWVDRGWFVDNAGVVEADDGTATAADGTELPVAGRGTMRFKLWGADLTENVRVMSVLPG